MTKKITLTGPVLIVIAALLWSVDGIVRRSLYSLPPITIVFFEHFIGSILIAPFFISTFKKHTLTSQVMLPIFTVSVLSSLLGTLWFTTALAKVNFISFSVVFLLQKLQPLFAIGSARIFLKEKISGKYIQWALLALIAAYFVTFKNGVVNFATGTATVTAALYALGAAFAWGTGTTFSKMVLNKISDVQTTGLRFFITTLLALVGVIVLGQASSLSTPSVSQFARFLFIALSTGLVALYIYYKGLQQTEVRISTLVELVFPVSAILIDGFLYKTWLAPSQYIATCILFVAIYMISKISKKSEVDVQY